MLTIRPYRESDAESVGRLIADTYSRFNLSFASSEELGKLLGPFRHAWSAEPAHREAIAEVIRPRWSSSRRKTARSSACCAAARSGWQACSSGAIAIGTGSGGDWWSNSSRSVCAKSVTVIRVAATLYAIPFYTAVGYRRTTGVRNGWSFEGTGLQVSADEESPGEHTKMITRLLVLRSDSVVLPFSEE